MQIREISVEELDYVAVLCLDPWMPPKWREAMKPAMDTRKEWLKTMMRKELQVSVALEKSEEILCSFGVKNAKVRELVVRGSVPEGLIEYMPIEIATEPVKGEKSLFINCIWVLSKFWHAGIGKGLLERFIEKARVCGGASVLAYEGDKWFGLFPYMPVAFFKKFGFKEVCRDGSRVLLHLNLGADEQPSLIYPKTKMIEEGDKMVIDVFFNSQCPWSRWMADKIKRNIKKYDVTLNTINTDDRKVIEEYGMSRGVCANGVPVIKRMAAWKEIESIVKEMIKH